VLILKRVSWKSNLVEFKKEWVLPRPPLLSSTDKRFLTLSTARLKLLEVGLSMIKWEVTLLALYLKGQKSMRLSLVKDHPHKKT